MARFASFIEIVAVSTSSAEAAITKMYLLHHGMESTHQIIAYAGRKPKASTEYRLTYTRCAFLRPAFALHQTVSDC